MTVRSMTPVLAAVALAALGTTLRGQPMTSPPATHQAAVPHVPNEPHPQIRKAIRALEAAKVDLQHASHDFGGHRAAALASCDNAIQQLRLALQYDKR